MGEGIHKRQSLYKVSAHKNNKTNMKKQLQNYIHSYKLHYPQDKINTMTKYKREHLQNWFCYTLHHSDAKARLHPPHPFSLNVTVIGQGQRLLDWTLLLIVGINYFVVPADSRTFIVKCYRVLHYYLGLHFDLDKIKTSCQFYSCEPGYHSWWQDTLITFLVCFLVRARLSQI